jgi:hypothetical protein
MDIGQLVKKRLAVGDYSEGVVVDQEWEAFEVTDRDLAEGGTVEEVVARKRARNEMMPLIIEAEETETAE